MECFTCEAVSLVVHCAIVAVLLFLCKNTSSSYWENQHTNYDAGFPQDCFYHHILVQWVLRKVPINLNVLDLSSTSRWSKNNDNNKIHVTVCKCKETSKNQKWKKFQGWKYNQTAYKLQYVHMNCGKHTSPLDTTQSLTACSCFGRYFLGPFTLRRTWPNTSQPIMVRWIGYWSAFDKQTLPTQTFHFQFHLFSVRTTHVQPYESRPHLHCP